MKINVSVKGNTKERPRLMAVFPVLYDLSQRAKNELVLSSKDKVLLGIAIKGIEEGKIPPYIFVERIEKLNGAIIIEIFKKKNSDKTEQEEIIPPVSLGNGFEVQVGGIYRLTLGNDDEFEVYFDEHEKVYPAISFALINGDFCNPLSPYLDINLSSIRKKIKEEGLKDCKLLADISDQHLFKKYLDEAAEFRKTYSSDIHIHHLAEKLLNVLKYKNSEDVSEQAFLEHLKVFEQEYFNRCN